ncbi:MAG: hypothetical protein LBT01_08180 [Spirochaetaceae bacterium]|jgi:energy-coupling factor transporter transmembrane protein EcfT|nr:hypothetical protein [Spirochaetaceae bacterium]
MKSKNIVFRYKKGKTFIYRVPALVKLVLLFPLAILIMYMDITSILIGIGCMGIITRICGFSFLEQMSNIKPALFYGVFLYGLGLIGKFIAFIPLIPPPPSLFIPNDEYILLVCRLLLVMQLSALFFRTTTSIEIKDALFMVEITSRSLLRKMPLALGKNISLRARLAPALALLLSFIPEIFELWNALDTSYTARCGRGGLKKIKIVLFALLTLCFHSAAERAKALEARGLESG